MDQRAHQRTAAARTLLGAPPDRIEPASADASFRSYWRLFRGSETWILMDAPPALEDLEPFVAVAGRLAAAGLHPPEILAADLQGGFLLLEDLGRELFSDLLDAHTAEALYGEAFGVLRRLATVPVDGLPPYSRERLEEELALFPDWFVARQLGREPDRDFHSWWQPLVERLVTSALAQPQVFVHRDFHCANLMPRRGQPAVLDFQDAVVGPITYDPVSLLLDRYVTWPEARVMAWSERHRREVAPEADPATWQRWLDWMGLQRNLKVIGIFARLNLRDGKPRYLQWQPRFGAYVSRVAGRYPEFEALADFMARLDSRTLAWKAA